MRRCTAHDVGTISIRGCVSVAHRDAVLQVAHSGWDGLEDACGVRRNDAVAGRTRLHRAVLCVVALQDWTALGVLPTGEGLRWAECAGTSSLASRRRHARA